MPSECSVHVIEPDMEINTGCKMCRRPISTTKDKFLIGLMIKEDKKEFRYFLGVDPPIMCCGEEKLVIKTFDTDEEAEAEKTRVMQYLDEHGSTEGLKLLGFHHFGMN